MTQPGSVDPKPTPPRDAMPFIFSAVSRGELVRRLSGAVSAGLGAGFADLAGRLAVDSALGGAHRLAIVANHQDDLQTKIERALRLLSTPDESPFNLANAVIYSPPRSVRGATAFLFAGFGAQGFGVFAELASRFSRVRNWFHELAPEFRARILENPLLFPTSVPSQSREQNRFGSALFATLDAILAVDLALHMLLDGLGLRCDAIAGHSFGENAALVASGVVPGLEQVASILAKIAWSASESIEAQGGQHSVHWLALPAGSRVILDGLSSDVAPSVSMVLDNCSQQTVVCGPVDEIGRVELAIRSAGGLCFRIPGLDMPVHSPQFPVAADRLSQIYADLEVAAPRQALFSCTTASPFPADPSAIRELLARQWVSPVRFRETIESLYRDGVRTFVEIGPGSRLVGFVRDTLRGTDAFAVSTNHEGRDPSLQLTTALALLFVRGHDLDLAGHIDELRRDPQPLLDGDRPYAASSETFSPNASGVGAINAVPTFAPTPLALGLNVKPLIHDRVRSDRELRQTLIGRILTHIASVMGLTGTGLIDPDRGFFEQGMTSLNCVEMVASLEPDVGRRLDPTIAFDYPSVHRLADHLSQFSRIGPNDDEARPRGKGFEASPIAVVGMGCRFPGQVSTPESFWSLIRDGRDAITERPEGRSAFGSEDGAPDLGGFLDDVRGFDPEFFGISPREAETLDPQQRLLLEVAWEAIEHAAIDASDLRDSATGVFIGISGSEYAQRFSMRERMAIGGYIGTGNASSIAAGRLAFVLGLNGPCLAVDTACSSSLVAVHLACQSLRLGECEAALAGGVNLLLGSETSFFLRQAGALALNGRCKAFDASGDGYVRSEGCGMVVLKRLADAVAAGDSVLAVIRGSAVNHDGRTSGLTVPNGLAQEAVIRRALTDAGIEPGRVGYVEAHGTGTVLGDPIEVQALARVFGPFRTINDPLAIGSVKTNIGHLEAAAGVAGLIKVILMLRHQSFVPSLHLRTPNPKVDWDRIPLRVCVETQTWSADGLALMGAVSSFGMSGTNAHLIVEGPPETPAPSARAVPSAPFLLTLSSRTEVALSDLAARYRDRLSSGTVIDLADVGYTSQVGRTHFPHRRALVLDTLQEAGERLGETAQGGIVAAPTGRRGRPRVVFLFTGQGAQFAGMGRRLFETEPVFRRCLEECDAWLQPRMGRSLLELWFAEPGRPAFDQTASTQPALFVLEYALAQTWRSWGVIPDAVMGHSIGEYAAACVAGVFSLEDGLGFVADRAALMQSLPLDGAMTAVRASEALVREVLGPGAVEVAAVNGPEQVVISGPATAIATAEQRLKSRGISTVRIRVSHAFHSAAMDPIIGALRDRAAQVRFSPPRIPLISNLTGRSAGTEITTPEYWADHARRTVRFADGMRSLVESGSACFLEVGPRPVLSSLGRSCLADSSHTWLASLSPPSDDRRQMLESLGALYEAGLEIDWTGFHLGRQRRKTTLPNYPFQREPYWIEAPKINAGPNEDGHGAARDRTLLGNRVDQPDSGSDGAVRYESRVGSGTCRLLLDQRLMGRPHLPVAGLLALMVSAGADLADEGADGVVIERFVAHQVADSPDPSSITLHTRLVPRGDGGFDCSVYAKESQASGSAAWSLLAESVIRRAALAPNDAEYHETIDAEHVTSITGGDFYQACERVGIAYGPSLRVVEEIRIGGSRTTGRLKLPDTSLPEERKAALIDGAFQTVGAMLSAQGWNAAAVRSMDRFWIGSSLFADVAVSVLHRPLVDREPMVLATITDPSGNEVIARLEGIRLQPTGTAGARSRAADRAVSKILQKVRAASDGAAREKMLLDYLNQLVCVILRFPRGRILDAFQPLNQIGLDSLMALQLSGAMQFDLAVHVPPVKIVEGHSLATLAELIQKEVVAERPEPPLERPGHGSPAANPHEWTEGVL